jgi:hypothetical protein
MYLYILLFISVVLNIFAFAYSIRAARRLLIVDTNLEGIEETFSSFKSHLEVLYESEVFYGDESLKALIDHSNMVLDEIEKYDNLYLLTFDDEEQEVSDIA